MKSVILAGAPRSGKTTLTKRLQREKGLAPIFSDMLVGGFRDHFPELGILHCGERREAISRNLFPFLNACLEAHDWQQSPFVLDTNYLYPQQVVDHGLDKKYKVLFIGCPNISASEKLRNIRQHPNKPNDWTEGLSDEDVLKAIQDITGFSKILEA